MTLTDKTLVVMGGTSGIGLATAHAAVKAGARVIVAGRHQDKLALAVAGLGDTARGESVDAADRDALDAFFARTGDIDHLVVAAAGGRGSGALAPRGPAGRAPGVGGPEADAIVFLAGNDYVTGVILDVDGGMRGASPG